MAPSVRTSVDWRPVPVRRQPLERLRPYLAPGRWEAVCEAREAGRSLLAGRRVWILNSAAVGGGVAQLTRTLSPYWMDAGADVRWLVLDAPAEFFRVTKGVHNLLHGHAFDGVSVGPSDVALYDAVCTAAAEQLRPHIRAGELVVLHDPQTAGVAAHLIDAGAIVLWRCHVGADAPNALTHAAWEVLAERVASIRTAVFTVRAHVPAELGAIPVRLITPAIDPAARRHRALSPAERRRILAGIGLPPAHEPMALHLARWDPLKDPLGVLRAFTEHTAEAVEGRLVLAGPDPAAIPDDPTAEETYESVVEHWQALPSALRRRVDVLCLPLDDRAHNENLVNALQRSADVFVKKSLEEGFGLGVTEAMWKRIPVVAAGVGGIRAQVEDGRTGVLVDDPRDLAAFGAALANLLADRESGRELGTAGRERVRELFLADRHLIAWIGLLCRLTET